MIANADELGIKVKKVRLLTKEEFEEFADALPEVSYGICWWLANIDPDDDYSVAYAEGNYTEEDMYCDRGEVNMHIRVALDIEDTAEADLEAGDEFIYCGFVFTVLDDSLAISNNFIGCAKYYDEDIAECMFSDDEITCTLDGILSNLFPEYEDADIYDVISDETRSLLEDIDLEDESDDD